MNHVPYEQWLFSEASLSLEQQRLLQAHLQECEQCRLLQLAWNDVNHFLRSEQTVEPANGFAERWRVRLESSYTKGQARKNNRKSWIFFFVDLGAAAMLFTLLLIRILNVYDTPLNFIFTYISHFATYIAFLTTFAEFLVAMVKVISSIISPASWLALGFALLGMNLFWIISLRVLLSPWRLR